MRRQRRAQIERLVLERIGIWFAVDENYTTESGEVDGTFDNIYVCNNTIIAKQYIQEPMQFVNRYSDLLTITLSNVVIKNNIFLDGNTVSFGGERNQLGNPAYDYTTNSFLFDYNICLCK